MSEQNQTQGTEAGEDEMLDITEALRPVAKQYGRELFAVVMATGICTVAMQHLGELVQRTASRKGASALNILGQHFNQVLIAYCTGQGWTEGLIAQCDRDVQIALRQSIVTPKSSIIQLNG